MFEPGLLPVAIGTPDCPMWDDCWWKVIVSASIYWKMLLPINVAIRKIIQRLREKKYNQNRKRIKENTENLTDKNKFIPVTRD